MFKEMNELKLIFVTPNKNYRFFFSHIFIILFPVHLVLKKNVLIALFFFFLLIILFLFKLF